MNNKESLTDNFNQKNHQDELILYKNPEVIDQIERIKKRANELHQNFEKHCDKHWKVWVKREQDLIFDRRFGDVKPEPKYGNMSMSWEDAMTLCFNEAREKINAQIKAFHENVDADSQRKQDLVMNKARQYYQSHGLARQRLDQEVTEIHQSIHRQRMDAYHDFENNKGQRVEEARKNLSQTPERDVYENYKQQDREILAHKEHQIQQAYEKHGFNYEMEKHALTQKFTQKM